MKNKIATLFLTFVLMATMLCGCAGGSTEQPNEPNRTGQTDAENGNREQTELDLGPTTGEISFYVAGGPMELALWDKLISEFEKQNGGITVKKIQFSNYDTVFSALQAGNAPDVIRLQIIIWETGLRQEQSSPCNRSSIRNNLTLPYIGIKLSQCFPMIQKRVVAEPVISMRCPRIMASMEFMSISRC